MVGPTCKWACPLSYAVCNGVVAENTYVLSEGDSRIIDAAQEAHNPSIFTDYYFRNQLGGFMVYPGSVRHSRYIQMWEDLNKPASFTGRSSEVTFEVFPQFGDFSEYVKVKNPGLLKNDDFVSTLATGLKYSNIAFFEKRGFLFLPWTLAFERARQEQLTVIGTTGTGKTMNMGIAAMVKCATIPNFRFLNVAPTIYQSSLMVRSIQERTNGTLFEQRFLLNGRHGFKEKPYAIFKFANGSTAEFMNVEKNASNVQSWYGDWINVDEAGLLYETDETGQTALGNILIGLATRLRGERPDGKPRMGRLSMISMAYDCDTLWDIYDMGLSGKQDSEYYSALVTHKDNPYLTPKDIARIERNIPAGQEGQWLRGERPTKKGAEFPSNMVDQFFSESQWIAGQQDTDVTIEITRPGVTHYVEPPIKDHVYLMAGDPGLGEPPYRNAPVVLVFDVTDFPHSRAKLVMFWWGYANGSLNPFLSCFSKYAHQYKVPNSFRAYDSTSTQRHIAELANMTGEDAVVPLGFDGVKKWEYINAAKLLMSKGLLMAPSGLKGLEKQLRDYRLPDKKLAQDLVSTLCMASYLMFPLYKDTYPSDIDDDQAKENSRKLVEILDRNFRPDDDRGPARDS